MSIGDHIIAAVAFSGLPCAYEVYGGSATTFLTYNMNSVPTNFADDAPQHDRWLIQLHLFAQPTTDTTTLRNQIKAALFAAGFTYPSQVDATAPDDPERHVVFDFETAEGTDA